MQKRNVSAQSFNMDPQEDMEKTGSDNSNKVVEVSTSLGMRPGYIRNLDDLLRLLKGLSDFLVASYIPLMGCLGGCTINALLFLMSAFGLFCTLVTRNSWLLIVVILPVLKLLAQGLYPKK